MTTPLLPASLFTFLPLALICSAGCVAADVQVPNSESVDAGDSSDAMEPPAEATPSSRPGFVGPSSDRVAPEYISSRQVNARHLVFEQDTLVWMDDSFGKRGLRTTGSGEHYTLSEMSMGAEVLSSASDEEGMYFGAGDKQIYYYSWKDHTFVNFSELASPAVALAITPTTLYWASASGCVFHSSRSGSKSETLACADGVPTSLALTGTRVYWTTAEGVLFQASLAAESFSEELVRGDFSAGIVADANGVYWADGERREVMRYDRASESLVTISSGHPSPIAIAQDRFYVYFSTQWDGGVKRVRKTGSDQVEILAQGLARPGEIVVSTKSVYWVNKGEGSIMRIPR